MYDISVLADTEDSRAEVFEINNVCSCLQSERHEMMSLQHSTAQHSTAQHSTAQHCTYHMEFDTPFRYVSETQASRMEAHVKCDTMSTPMSPALTLRPAVLNCSELYLWPANLTSIQTSISAMQAKKTPKPHTMTHPATCIQNGQNVVQWHAAQCQSCPD